MWKLEWEALSTRIAGIIVASGFLFQTAQAGESDHGYSTNILVENCKETAKAVLQLRRYSAALPANAWQVLTRFEKWWTDTEVDSSLSPSGGFPQVQALVVLLASVRSELDHVLEDHDSIIRNHVTRAFLHLQRSLLVDAELQKKWLDAFEYGEVACERLGAVHLLLHGIWAFKVDTKGQRTDLVLGTHLVVDSDVISAAHGLVLTEWKLVRDTDSPEGKAREAKSEAARYSEGGLAGFQLETEKYLVLVGKEEFKVPDDIRDGQVLYKVKPLFLKMQSPSVAARKNP